MTKKTMFTAVLAFLGVAAIFMTLATQASAQTRVVSYTIPFDFHAGGKLLPSGDYEVTAVNRSADVLRFRNAKGDVAMFMTIGTQNKNIGLNRLVFNRYGKATFLSEIHWQGYGDGRRLLESAVEREARNTAAAIRVAVVPK